MSDEPDYKRMWEMAREANTDLARENARLFQENEALKAEIKRLTGIDYSPPVA